LLIGTQITCAKFLENQTRIVGEPAIWKKFDDKHPHRQTDTSITQPAAEAAELKRRTSSSSSSSSSSSPSSSSLLLFIMSCQNATEQQRNMSRVITDDLE